ncbi:MAG TPA: YidC/Oxa1 family membrane protein insertase [Patescibacteria group bacterium]|nr:YidC/Oxa1 family membrane protein insertase [Patescibacteria group bacterium]
MGQFWHDYLYTPLLNILFFLYSGPAFGNLGVAVIELTVALRVALLPFTIVDERNRFRYEKLDRKIETIERDFKTDHVMRAEKIRDLLKQHKVSYWSKVIVLGVQLLTLILLYQVFIGGIRFTHNEVLYTWVQVPGQVNVMFLGFNIAEKSLLWASIVAVILFLQIYAVQKQREHLIRRSDVMYLFLFPIFSLVVLLLLPMVKSLFVLTSMLFSMFIFGSRKALFKVPNSPSE